MAIRSAAALRRLYERYRTAPVWTGKAKPGEWLDVAPGSDEAQWLQDALGVDSTNAAATDAAQDDVQAYGLNGALRVRHAMDVRLVWYRPQIRRPSQPAVPDLKLRVRFTLIAQDGKIRGAVPTPRAQLPAIESENLTLDLGAEEIRARAAEILGQTPEPEPTPEPPISLTMPDGSPLPDLSKLLSEDELRELAIAGLLSDQMSVEALFADYAEFIQAALDDDAIDRALTNIRSGAPAPTPPPLPSPHDAPARPWGEVVKMVADETLSAVRQYRDFEQTGRLLILAPSPGTGKTAAMIDAAIEDHDARRRVGYAVLSREQIKETRDRFERRRETIHLIVVEGRHKDNCREIEQVEMAAAAGFSPGTAVCPNCDLYPVFRRRNDTGARVMRPVCGYYRARMEAADDRIQSEITRRKPAIILTTHASAVQGSHIIERRFQSFWNFDTLFIDEDPTGSLIQQLEIPESSLHYHGLDEHGNPDPATRVSRILRDTMTEAMRQRAVAAERGFMALGSPEKPKPDPIHTRDNGSSYAGRHLHALIDGVAQQHRLSLDATISTAIDSPHGDLKRGGMMTMSRDDVAKTYPNRYLVPLGIALQEEVAAFKDAGTAGFEPAYRAHLDLVQEDTDTVAPVLRLHISKGYANGRTNIVIGDAYANVGHYESIFSRLRRDNRVDVIKHTAVWPTSSSLIRIVVHAGAKTVRLPNQHADHLETKVRPLLDLERGRRILFYTYKDLRAELTAWLESVREEFELAEYAVEHWGSGRGKDIYRDFDTFIGATEYMPNVGALLHESNVSASLADVSSPRVAHWNSFAERRGSMTFANSLSTADPVYQAVFHRKATDELAQAVHRIRPAIPAPDGRQKRAYVLGHRVPWTDELIAATAATAVVDNSKSDVDLETEALGRGARFVIDDTLGLLSAREVAGAIAEVFRQLGCWSNAFAHALLGVATWEQIELTLRGTATQGDIAIYRRKTEARPLEVDSPLIARVCAPPVAWRDTVRRVHDCSRVYHQGMVLAHEAVLGSAPSGRACPTWSRGRGFEFFGDGERFDRVFAAYAPGAQKVPF